MKRPRLHLSPSELDELMGLKLCFQYKTKWFRGHVCANLELHILTIMEGVEIEVLPDYDDEEVAEHEEQSPQLMEISLNAYFGIESPTTTKLRGKIGKYTVVVLLDSGATHNFVIPQLVAKVGLALNKNSNLQIILGTGVTVSGVGICTDGKLALQHLDFTLDFISLELGKVDVVLGMQWLRTLGECEVNWLMQEWSFIYNGKREMLVGELDLHRPATSFSLITNDDGQWAVPRESWLHSVAATPKPLKVSAYVEKVRDEFVFVFSQPQGIPPVRGREHAIFLKPGTTTINVRPYRYPQAHKDAMTKMVTEMLAKGLIRASRSSFSSPVLLAKKQDKSWRFCVDYRALNQSTVADKSLYQ